MLYWHMQQTIKQFFDNTNNINSIKYKLQCTKKMKQRKQYEIGNDTCGENTRYNFYKKKTVQTLNSRVEYNIHDIKYLY